MRFGNKKKTLLRHADLHVIAALYWIKRKRIEVSYKRVMREIKKIVLQQKSKEGQKFSLNRVFTKNDNTWESLKKSLHLRTHCY